MLLGIDPRITANNAVEGSDLYRVAAAVCFVRGLDPHAMSREAGVANWRAIILEEALRMQLAVLIPR